MQFDSFADFINMGGYAFYVWLSFGVSFGLLFMLTLSSKLSLSKVKQDIAKQTKREQKLKEAAKMQKAAKEVTHES